MEIRKKVFYADVYRVSDLRSVSYGTLCPLNSVDDLVEYASRAAGPSLSEAK